MNDLTKFKTKYRPVPNPHEEKKTFFFDPNNKQDSKFIKDGHFITPKAVWSVYNSNGIDTIKPGYDPEADLWIATVIRWQDPDIEFQINLNELTTQKAAV
jgi:hypothetical protein